MDPDLKQWLQVLTPALIPTLAVLIAMLQNKVGLDAVARRVDDVGRRIDDTNTRINDTNRRIDDTNGRFSDTNRRFESLTDLMNKRFDAVDRRFDANEAIWRAELHRVEEVLDARLKHLEESR